MNYCFQSCDGLTTTGPLPNSVINAEGIFQVCANLKKVERLPDSIENLNGAFTQDILLEEVENIPKNVEKLLSTFDSCYKLLRINNCIIPESASEMKYTFRYCYRLEGIITINANPADYDRCFLDCSTAIEGNLILKGTSTILTELLNTKTSNSKIIIE